MNTIKNKWLLPLEFKNIYLIWGITFLVISFGLKGFPPFMLSGLRFISAGMLVLGYLLSKGDRPHSLTNFIVGAGLVACGEQFVTAAEAGCLFTHQFINRHQLVGLFILLIGVVLTNFTKYIKISGRSKVKIRRTSRIVIGIGSQNFKSKQE